MHIECCYNLVFVLLIKKNKTLNILSHYIYFLVCIRSESYGTLSISMHAYAGVLVLLVFCCHARLNPPKQVSTNST